MSSESESLESELKQLQEQQALILKQVDRAIALFDSSDQLINYNQAFLNFRSIN
jgi:hypothetical protein